MFLEAMRKLFQGRYNLGGKKKTDEKKDEISKVYI
jgi:hypothetical protein